VEGREFRLLELQYETSVNRNEGTYKLADEEEHKVREECRDGGVQTVMTMYRCVRLCR